MSLPARRNTADGPLRLRWGTVQRPANGKPFVRFSVQMFGEIQGARLNGEIDVEVEGDIPIAAWAEGQLALALQSVVSELHELAANRAATALLEVAAQESGQ